MATILHDSSSTISVAAPSGVARAEPGRAPLLVATDATTASDSALRMAAAIAARSGQRVMVVSVRLLTPMTSPEMQMAMPPRFDEDQRGALCGQVAEQLERVGITDRWPVEILLGDPAAQIVQLAGAIDAALVIMGLGQHELFDRLLGDETVLRVLRLGTVPVLAVAPGSDELPHRILAATDFTPSSVRAAMLATRIAGDDATFTLAHVLGEDADPAFKSMAAPGRSGGLGRAFDLAIDRMGADASRIQRCVLAGDPAKALLEMAATTQPDLLVSGSHGHGFLTRLMLGSVSQRLIRSAQCSVLVAPPAAGPNFLDEVPSTSTRFAAYEWSERLEEFTRRNAGRRGTLEVIDAELGAQVEEAGLPFVGAAFDSRDGRVQIMLGDAVARGRHLTRSIDGAYAVQVLRDRQGRDLVLRVAHGRGQTLLTLVR
jgi:universal stress protein E